MNEVSIDRLKLVRAGSKAVGESGEQTLPGLKEIWERMDAAAEEEGEQPAAEFLRLLARALEGTKTPLKVKYQTTLEGLSRAFEDGRLEEKDLIENAQRLVRGEKLPGAAKIKAAAGLAEGIIKMLGGEKRMAGFAEKFGVSELMDSGLGLLRLGEPDKPPLELAAMMVVNRSVFASPPEEARIHEAILKAMLEEMGTEGKGNQDEGIR